MVRLNSVHAFGYITPPKINRFGWNLGHFEYTVCRWPWQILGAIRAETRARERAEILFFGEVNNAQLYRFLVSQISRKLHTRRGSVSRWILSEWNFENLPARGCFFPKRQNHQRLPTSDADNSLTIQTDKNSWPIGPSTECPLSIVTVGINSKSFPWPVQCAHEEHPLPKNTLLRCPVVVEKWRSINNSFAWRCHPANLNAVLLLILV